MAHLRTNKGAVAKRPKATAGSAVGKPAATPTAAPGGARPRSNKGAAKRRTSSAAKPAATETATRKRAAAKASATIQPSAKKASAAPPRAKKTAGARPSAKKSPAKGPPAKTKSAASPAAKRSATSRRAPRAVDASESPSTTKPLRLATTRNRATVEQLGAGELLARVALLARADEDIGDDIAPLIARLQDIATKDQIPAMFGVLDDDDPSGALWSVFYLLEGFDDDYLAGLLDALPALAERAPRWAETALLRIVNTRGEPEDCVATFIALGRHRGAAARKRLAKLLVNIARKADGLSPAQSRLLAEISAAWAA